MTDGPAAPSPGDPAGEARRQRRLPRAVREQQMLDAAVAVFARRGYHAASMDEIADVAGVSKPMVYAYVGAKEDLFAACIRREADRLLAAVVDAVTGSVTGRAEPPAEELLWRGLRAFFGFVHDHRDGWSVLHRQSHGEGEPDHAPVRGSIRDRAVGVVARLLDEARTDGAVTDGARADRAAGAGPDLHASATALVGAAEALADWMVDNDDAPDTAAARLMNLVWLGFDQLLRGRVWSAQGELRGPGSERRDGTG